MRRIRETSIWLSFAAVFFLLVGVPGASDAQSDRAITGIETLGAQQILEIRIGRWDPIQETYADWEAMGGTFPVSATGMVTLPLIGSLQATGLSPEALGAEISQRVQDRMGLRGEVQTVVAIAEFAPIYVLGDVGSPGSYQHAPNMTVLQALSLAGGIDQTDPQLLRGERSALNSLGNYRVMELELLRRLATLARLEAEEAGTDMVPPEELVAAPLGAELIEEERRIMVAQQRALASNLTQIDELEALLQERIMRLNTQAELRQDQLDLLDEELESTTSLVERGLSTAARASNLQREVADQQVRLLEVETARLNAEQQLNETRRDRLDLTNQRDRDRIQGLQDQRAAISELRIRMETEAALFSESVRTGNGLVELSDMVLPILQITRVGANGPETFEVDRHDRVMGGDVLEVVLETPDNNGMIPVRRLSPDVSGLPMSDAVPNVENAPSSAQKTPGLPPS